MEDLPILVIPYMGSEVVAAPDSFFESFVVSAWPVVRDSTLSSVASSFSGYLPATRGDHFIL